MFNWLFVKKENIKIYKFGNNSGEKIGIVEKI